MYLDKRTGINFYDRMDAEHTKTDGAASQSEKTAAVGLPVARGREISEGQEAMCWASGVPLARCRGPLGGAALARPGVDTDTRAGRCSSPSRRVYRWHTARAETGR